MGEIAEQNQWHKEKGKILDEFSGSHRALLSAIAGRGFCKSPGFLMEASLALEETGKNKLSALNYTITAEAIERELKQTGHDYSQAYKAARIAFELEKQTLLTALQQEFSDLDATQSLKKEELDRLFVDLDIRKIILITTKTTIELQMEDLKRQLAETDRLTFYNEEALVNAQVVTANKKLEVLPYLNTILVEEEKVLIQEQANSVIMESLIGEKKLLIDKKNEVLTKVMAKAVEALILSTAIIVSIPIERQIMTQKVNEASKRELIVDGKGDVIAAEMAVENLRSALSAARASLQTAKVNRQINVSAADVSNIVATAASHTAMITSIAGNDIAISGSNIAADASVASNNISGHEQAVDLTTTAEKAAISCVAAAQARRSRDVAKASAVADITSKLIHLIGS